MLKIRLNTVKCIPNIIIHKYSSRVIGSGFQHNVSGLKLSYLKVFGADQREIFVDNHRHDAAFA
jgi:hypothetical protein